MRLLRWHWLAIGSAVAVATACSSNSTTRPDCNGPGEIPTPAAVVITVRDSTTLAVVTDRASGTIHGTAPSDTLLYAIGVGTGQLIGYGGPGTYVVTVNRPGYAPWSRSGIMVSAGRCGAPNAVEMYALLAPEP